MRILDKNNNELFKPDYSLGYTAEEKLFIQHHDAIEPIQEVGHYETIAEYPNGGKDVQWVIDVEGIEAKDAWDEYEDILRYIEYSEEELAIRKEQENKPTQLDIIEAQVAYTAMMTDTLLEG